MSGCTLTEVPLSVSLRFARGEKRRHDYSELPCQPLARQLAAAQISMANAGGGIKTAATSMGYARAIRRFCAFCGEQGHSGDASALSAETLAAFARAADAKVVDLAHALLCRIDELHEGALSEGVLALAQRSVRRARKAVRASTPVAPLGPTEADALEAACRAEIAEVEQRLAEGQQLVAERLDPAEHGFSDESICWWLAEHGPGSLEELAAHCGVHRNTFANQVGKRHRGLPELTRLLYPSRDDLVPFLLLLGLRTGISPEGVAWLEAGAWNDIGAGKIRLRWYKARGGGAQADTFAGRGQWSPGGLLGRARAATTRSRQFADEHECGYLWLAPHRGSGALVRTWDPAVARFCERHDLRRVDGSPLRLDRRALRKTFYARLDRRYHGAVNVIAGANQTPQVAADHYLAVTTETEVIAEAVAETQCALVARAEQARRVTVLDEQEAPRLEADAAAAAHRLGLSDQRAQRLLATDEEDVFAAKCKDFHNGPHAAPGQPCQAAVWECLFCPLAVITPSKLPNLLALLDHIDAAYERMSIADWQARYAAARRAITEQILPRFSDQVVAAARAKVSEQNLYLPPEEELA